MIALRFYGALAVCLAAAMFFAIERHDREVERPATTQPESLQVEASLHVAPREPLAALGVPRSPHPVAASVAEKYDPLLVTLAAATREQLGELLIGREAAGTVDLYEITNWERRISLLLLEDEYSLYERLRESQRERAQVRAFAQQLLPTSALTPEQQRALLAAKLQHKDAVQTLELHAESAAMKASGMEREYARDIATQGLIHYERTFLDEARAVLSDEQWVALEQFESARRTAWVTANRNAE
jgi:hypothetical protein